MDESGSLRSISALVHIKSLNFYFSIQKYTMVGTLAVSWSSRLIYYGVNSVSWKS